MSNKFGFKFNKLFIILIFIFIIVKSYGFEPKVADFQNSYQYDLYRSWLNTEKLYSDLPAGFTNKKVVRSFLDKNDREINVEYDWHNWKITSQREIIPFLFYIDDELMIRSYINYVERFIYRMNCNEIKFISDFVNHNKVVLEYNGFVGESALNKIWEDRPSLRINFYPVALVSIADTLKFRFTSDDMNDFTISFPQVHNIDDIMSAIKKREFVESDKSFPPIIEQKEEEVRPQIEDLSLAEYIRIFFKTPPRRELLHNKIKDIRSFFTQEFTRHTISNEQNIWHLEIDKYENNLDGDISVEVVFGEDMLEIFSLNEFELNEKKIKLGSDEIDLSNLSESEISGIANYLPQLVYEHRALGSKLLNFLLIHDEVPSTLVVYSEVRELYETDSYSDILLLLNKYWQDRTVYFGIENVKKINGTIEFKGFLIAKPSDGSSRDLAEIFFHVSREYKIDIIMMILHTNIDS